MLGKRVTYIFFILKIIRPNIRLSTFYWMLCPTAKTAWTTATVGEQSPKEKPKDISGYPCKNGSCILVASKHPVDNKPFEKCRGGADSELAEKMNRATNVSDESEKKARLAILEVAHMMSVPMSLKAVINLKVPEAIWQGGSNAPLSASQILARIRPNGGGGGAENLERILRLLTSYNIFAEHLITGTTGGERRYSLTDIGKALVDDDQGLSYAYYMLQHHEDALMQAWPFVEEAVEDPTVEPFKKVHGEGPFEYYSKRPDMANLYAKAMSGINVPLMREMLECYNGFEGVETLVDVGGGTGLSLRMIMQKYPNVKKGINFDFPYMLACAPQAPGVTNVGGDAFESVPSGDAIFMKWLFVAWTDEECKQVLQNCYKALPANGKVIACEPVVPELTDESQRTRTLLEGDIYIMTMYRSKGKHRTEQQYKQLGISAGFSRFHAFYDADPYMGVLEFHK